MYKNPRACLYQPLSNHIHQYTFRESSRRAVNEFTDLLTYIVNQPIQVSQLTLLLDIRESGLPPVVHIHSQIKAMFAEIPNMPALHIAVVYRAGSLLSATGSFMIPQRTGDRVRMFQDDIDAAVGWLNA